MSRKYAEYKGLDLVKTDKEISEQWDRDKIFEKSISSRLGKKEFVFYEGPPSANGEPGIHHVMARAIKDIFCRYKTLKGYLVKRKAGWDTHGLPVEISVEKTLGITKDDIGKSISIAEYNNVCRKEVMKYKDAWDDLTRKIGFWVDLDNPYVTFESKYIESVWHLLKVIYDKGLIYKGYTIQPYSPAAGTGLSTHELNQPGCYKDVKDNSVVAMFKQKEVENTYFLAWTTTPWTLPSNTALAVGKKIVYVKVNTFNAYTFKPITVILAKNLLEKYFPEKNAALDMASYVEGQKDIPYQIVSEHQGSELVGIRYEQLLPYAQPDDGDAFRVVAADFVTTEDGTGIVHIAPSFGADDFRVGKQNGIGSLTMVDKNGKFVDCMGEFAGRFVKNEYDPLATPDSRPVDVDIIIKLKTENKAFKAEKYEHSYPHCWRTDKPILYYPLDSWFIKTTAIKERMIALNKTINWKPEATGTGRFGNWLENLVDWNLSRSRYWGVPLPIWRTADGSEEICIGSAEELIEKIEESIKAGFMEKNPYEGFVPNNYSEENYQKIDFHRPYVDEIILVSPTGEKMFRESDLIDVWFDSGAMPYAQFHYPFENKENLQEYFPADFIAEGVDQTRGWFFTLHAIATLAFDSVAYKTVVSNGLVLDKNGMKMSKRHKNAVDPFATVAKYGADATRWYMITNAQPWDNLKFDIDGIAEVQRKFFGTLYNTYSFFALYANIDGFQYREEDIPIHERSEIDRWILSELQTLIQLVDNAYQSYEPTKAGRAIQVFLDEHLSNWYVRLSRRRFWKGEYNTDKISAYQTLYKCLESIAVMASPIAPFYMDKLFTDLNTVSKRANAESVHLAEFPTVNTEWIDKELEARMQLAQRISSMVLSLRKKVSIRVRQPLNKILIPESSANLKERIESVKDLILSEVNVKHIEYISDDSEFLVKKVKPNFKTLGPKFGKQMKQLADAITAFDNLAIRELELSGQYSFEFGGSKVTVLADDVEITNEDISGWQVATYQQITVALDTTITEELWEEGIARELVNKIQNIRKERAFEVTDKICVRIENVEKINRAINNNMSYICTEILAAKLSLEEKQPNATYQEVELDEDIKLLISVEKN